MQHKRIIVFFHWSHSSLMWWSIPKLTGKRHKISRERKDSTRKATYLLHWYWSTATNAKCLIEKRYKKILAFYGQWSISRIRYEHNQIKSSIPYFKKKSWKNDNEQSWCHLFHTLNIFNKIRFRQDYFANEILQPSSLEKKTIP